MQRKLHLEKQAARLRRRLRRLKSETERLSAYRLAAFLAIFVVGTPLFFSLGPAAFWPAAFILSGIFALTIYIHRQRQLSLERHRCALKHKELQLARQAVAWTKLPAYAGPPVAPDHPFAADIDLAGPYSFHQLISIARTSGGHTRLYRWLSEIDPELTRARRRQQTVKELEPLTVLRQRLLIAADLAAGESGQWDTEKLLAWMETGRSERQYQGWLISMTALALLNLALFLADSLLGLPALWPYSLLLYAVLTFSQTRWLAPVFTEAASLQDAVRQLTAIFRALETFHFNEAPRLVELCLPFKQSGRRPSDFLRRVARVVNATSIRNNPLLWTILNLLVPWDFYFAYRLSRVKAAVAAQLPDWLDRYYQMEAYCSLADYAYLNPAYHWPVLEKQTAPYLAATALGHPLIPQAQRVANDFSLAGAGAMALITGSNMSGKSTFLRTVGLNLVAALAGGPVVANSFVCSELRLFSSIKLSDSVTDGISYFYAEVRRLRALLDAIEEGKPLFFLIDEIFRGTNNEERRLGSEALIRALSQTAAAGLISTHDLGLVALADEIPTLTNYHFRDEIAGDTMAFDYQLRAGPSPTTNALHIMRSAGLPVPPVKSS